MKLIYISHWRFPSEKTMSPLIMKTCETFARAGVDVELWIPWRQNQFAHENPFEYHGVEKNFVIRRLPALDLTGTIPGNFWFLVMVGTFTLSLFCYSFFRRLKGAVLYAHDVRDVVILFGRKVPIFLEIHDFYKSSASWINRWGFGRARAFVVTNRYKMNILEREFGIVPERMLHKPNAVDAEKFQTDMTQREAREKLALPLDKKIILYTGSLFDWKGVDTLLDVHSLLDEGEVIYFVGGTDDDIERFRKRVQEQNIKNIIIAGRKPHDEIPLWVTAADVLVLPNTAKDKASKYETSPVKLFEYMASGRPVVASDLPSIRNVVDEELVFFFEPDNSQSLAHMVHYALNHKDECIARARCARTEVQKYSWEKRIGGIILFLEKYRSV